MTCASSTLPGCSASTVFFHQGAPRLAEGTLGTGRPGRAAAAHLSPAGQLQVATALHMLAAPGARVEPQHDVGIKHPDEGVEIAPARCREEGVDHLSVGIRFR